MGLQGIAGDNPARERNTCEHRTHSLQLIALGHGLLIKNLPAPMQKGGDQGDPRRLGHFLGPPQNLPVHGKGLFPDHRFQDVTRLLRLCRGEPRA